jgi:hypothetical protein
MLVFINIYNINIGNVITNFKVLKKNYIFIHVNQLKHNAEETSRSSSQMILQMVTKK